MTTQSIPSIQEYFNSTVQKVLFEIGCTMDINITMIDFDTIKELPKKTKNQAIGICWQNEFGQYRINIDEFFVGECYKYFVLDSKISTWELCEGETLEQVICHELAHTQVWNHTKKHTNLTNELLSKVTLPRKYHEYMEKKIARMMQEG